VVDAKLDTLEGKPGGYLTSGQGLAGLNTDLGLVYAAVDSADVAPTTQAVATFDGLQRKLGQLSAEWNTVKTQDINSLNQQLRKAHLSTVNVSEAAASEHQ